VTTAQIRYSMRRLRRRLPDKFILVTMAGATDVDKTSLFQSGEQGTLVQESLTDTVMNIKLVAVGSADVAKAVSTPSTPPQVSSNKDAQAELPAI
jgi:hypothetical protein